METVRSLESLKTANLNKTVVALGLFDGVHLGHAAVIKKACSLAKDMGATAAVFTFSADGDRPTKKKNQGFIATETVKFGLFEKLGVSFAAAPKFEQIKNLSPKAFVKDILIDAMRAKAIVCGYDFHFGSGASASAEDLKSFAKEYGCEVTVIPAQKNSDGEAISSTGIRLLLEAGKIKEANALLGHCYQIDFEVESGRHLGSKLGFPTINQAYRCGYAVPKFGVYAAAALIKGQYYPAVANVGVKPTVGGVKNPLAETYIMGIDSDLYGKHINVSFLEFLRPEKKFDSIEELKNQIEINSRQAKEIFDRSDFCKVDK